jgi:hypothetical protein
MKFMALIHSDEGRWDGLSEEAREQLMEQYFAFTREGREAGAIVGGNELTSTGSATTVRVRGEEMLVTDGPFAELKEALGGYYMFECASIEEACRWATKIPGAHHGAVEVRAVHVDEEEAS